MSATAIGPAIAKPDSAAAADKAAKDKADKEKADKEAEAKAAEDRAKAEAKAKAEAEAKAAEDRAKAEAKAKAEAQAANDAKKPESDTGEKGKGVTLLTSDCSLISGCQFSGNDNDEGAIEEAFNAVYPLKNLDLTLFEKVEPKGGVGGTWETKTPVTFISVKAGNEFILYQLAAPSTFGDWSTLGLDNKKGVLHDVSHYTLWEGAPVERVEITAVPEPAAWALLLMGFFGMGSMIRAGRRKRIDEMA